MNWRGGAMYSALAPDLARTWVRERLVPRLSGRLGRYAKRTFLGMPHTLEAAFFDNFAGIPLQRVQALIEPKALAASRPPFAASRGWLDRPGPGTPMLNRVLYADLKTYLVELLMKQDQMSMAASIESRVPFLDHKLIEFAAMLPPSAKLKGLTTKRLLRAAVTDLLPREILTRRKMGFPVPFARWMRSGWQSVARDVLLDRRARERGIFNAAAVEGLLDAHRTGAADEGDAIWGLLNLELWYRTCVDGDGVQVLNMPSGEALPDTVAPLRQALATTGDPSPHQLRRPSSPGAREEKKVVA
jgi:asparagine synthase (glutamine-hydrolysing)